MTSYNPYDPPKTLVAEEAVSPRKKNAFKQRTKLPWNLVIRWINLIYAIFGFGMAVFLTVKYFRLLTLFGFVSLGVGSLYLIASILLVKRRKLALYFFIAHLVLGVVYNAISAPFLLRASPMLVGWLITVIAIAICVSMWQKGMLK